MISRVTPQTFFSILEKIEESTFPLEYFRGESFIFLYKSFEGKTYKTFIIINPETLTVMSDNEEVTVEQFVDNLQREHEAIELLEPADYKDIILKHNHDAHLHANVGFDDILR